MTGNRTAVMRMIAQVIVAGGLVLALSVCSTTKLIDIICPPAGRGVRGRDRRVPRREPPAS